MSEQPITSAPEAPPVAPEAPVEAPVETAPAEAVAAPEAPSLLAEDGRAMAATFDEFLKGGQPTEEAPESQPRDERGRFVSASEDEVAEAPEADDPETLAASEGEVTEAEEADAPEAPPVFTIPENHWLRDRGEDEWDWVPADKQDLVRGLFNDATRRKQVEEAEQRVQQATQSAIDAHARIRALQAQLDKGMDHETLAQLQEIELKWGPDAAQKYREAFNAQRGGEIDRAAQEARQQYMAQMQEQSAQRFGQAVRQAAPQDFPHWNEGDLAQAWRMYGWEMGQRGVPWQQALSRESWLEYAGLLYNANPRVRSAIEAEVPATPAPPAPEATKPEPEPAPNPLGATPPVPSGTSSTAPIRTIPPAEFDQLIRRGGRRAAGA